LARGRTNFKRHETSKDPKYLKAAEGDLQEALHLNDLGKDLGLETEARLWLAKLYLRKGKQEPGEYDKVGPMLKGMIQIAPEFWLRSARSAIREELGAALSTGDYQAALRLFQAVHVHCDMLANRGGKWYLPAIALMVLGGETEGELRERHNDREGASQVFRETHSACDRELKSPGEDSPERVNLLMARSRIVLKEKSLKLKDLKAERPQCIADGDSAVEMAGRLHLSSSIQAEAWAQAGSARNYKVVLVAELSADEKRPYDLEAVSDLTKAVELAPKHPFVWIWHEQAGQCLSRLCVDRKIALKKRQDEYLPLAKDHCSKVKDDERAPASHRQEAKKLLDTLQDIVLPADDPNP
jgi:hypothetical protein